MCAAYMILHNSKVVKTTKFFFLLEIFHRNVSIFINCLQNIKNHTCKQMNVFQIFLLILF